MALALSSNSTSGSFVIGGGGSGGGGGLKAVVGGSSQLAAMQRLMLILLFAVMLAIWTVCLLFMNCCQLERHRFVSHGSTDSGSLVRYFYLLFGI